LKRRCLKWACIAHLDICNISYGQKKGRELNSQFDSQPLKVENRPNSLACRKLATYCWKSFDKGYNFASNLITIGGLHKKLCAFKVTGVQTVGISGLPLGSPGTKSHLDVAPRKIYYKGGRWWLPLGVQAVGISRFPLGSLGTKNHLDVAPVERCRVYYKGGRWWVPPSSGCGESCVSELPMGHPSTKSAPTMH
jgi:hypothetical protein